MKRYDQAALIGMALFGALILTVELLGAQPLTLEKWDPGFGPHPQGGLTGNRESRVREILNCPNPQLVCCDPCGICVCEGFAMGCPPIMMIGREGCRP